MDEINLAPYQIETFKVNKMFIYFLHRPKQRNCMTAIIFSFESECSQFLFLFIFIYFENTFSYGTVRGF